MHNSSCVVEVVNRTKKLLEVVPRELLIETATSVLNFDVREEVALFDELQNDEVNLNGLV